MKKMNLNFVKITRYYSFRWKCHPLQYKFVLGGVTFPAETVITEKSVSLSTLLSPLCQFFRGNFYISYFAIEVSSLQRRASHAGAYVTLGVRSSASELRSLLTRARKLRKQGACLIVRWWGTCSSSYTTTNMLPWYKPDRSLFGELSRLTSHQRCAAFIRFVHLIRPDHDTSMINRCAGQTTR